MLTLLIRIDDIPAYWQSLGQRFTGKNMGDIRGTRFEDINGDVSVDLPLFG